MCRAYLDDQHSRALKDSSERSKPCLPEAVGGLLGSISTLHLLGIAESQMDGDCSNLFPPPFSVALTCQWNMWGLRGMLQVQGDDSLLSQTRMAMFGKKRRSFRSADVEHWGASYELIHKL